MADVTVVGLTELGAKMDKLFKETAKKAIRKASAAGAEVFRRKVRANAPVRVEVGVTGFRKAGKGKTDRQPGYLKKHIGRQFKFNSDGSLSVFVGPTKSAFYAKFQELGTSHQPARPFMRPAFDSEKGAAEQAFARVAAEEIAKELK